MEYNDLLSTDFTLQQNIDLIDSNLQGNIQPNIESNSIQQNPTNTIEKSDNSRRTSIIIIIITIVLIIIILGIFIYMSFSNTGLFVPYKPPSNSDYYYPNGNVIPLTQEQIKTRKAILGGNTGSL
jgi:hypothetical protein